MYLLLKTSFTLAIPTCLSFLWKQYDVATSALLCLITSICNHSIRGQNKVIKLIDIFTMHGFGAYYTMRGIWMAISTQNYVYLIPSASAIAIVVVYWNIIHYIPNTSPQLYKHAIMHIVGSIGVCLYAYINVMGAEGESAQYNVAMLRA